MGFFEAYFQAHFAYLWVLLPAFVLAIYAQYKVKSTYSKYAKVKSLRGMTGAEAARRILDANGLHNVGIEQAQGTLTDHYDPRAKLMRLSNEVYGGTSVASISIASHEVGHAIQDHNGYAPLKLRSALVPLATLGSGAAMPLFLMGLVLAMDPLLTLGILLFSLALVFQVVTLPVEFNASRRAMVQMEELNLVTTEEIGDAKKMLNAAALTYVAAVAVSLATLIRLLLIRGRN